MTAFDYVVIAVVIGSVIVALMRGLVAEMLSLGTWLLAFWCAKEFAPLVADKLPGGLGGEGMRLVMGFVLLFFLVWLACALGRVVLTGLLDSVGLGGVNRLLGGVFGFARGLLLVTILVLLGGLSDLPKKPMWQEALLARPFEHAALSLQPWLPPMLAKHVSYP
jgi:membrane protein required for colicin V production